MIWWPKQIPICGTRALRAARIDAAFRAAYLQAVQSYEALRRQIDDREVEASAAEAQEIRGRVLAKPSIHTLPRAVPGSTRARTAPALSRTTLRKIQVLHVLSGHDKRDIAGDYVW